MAFEFFDPTQDVYIRYRQLPHWEQPGATYFITWRTADSIPTAVLQRWKVERAMWLRQHAIDPLSADWREQLRRLPRAARHDYHVRFTPEWMDCLDQCHGECVLRQAELSRIVDAAFVVMPNHVHVLVQFPGEGQLASRTKAWKHYTATQINARLGRQGRFWQKESFDHLVRSPEQFESLRSYIAANPAAAGFRQGVCPHYERE